MTDLQLELTKLIGKKDLSFGCLIRTNVDWIIEVIHRNDIFNSLCVIQEDNWIFISYIINKNQCVEIIWHPATLSDLHRFLNWLSFDWSQNRDGIYFEEWSISTKAPKSISYDQSKDLLEQSEETLQQIIELIKKYSYLERVKNVKWLKPYKGLKKSQIIKQLVIMLGFLIGLLLAILLEILLVIMIEFLLLFLLGLLLEFPLVILLGFLLWFLLGFLLEILLVIMIGILFGRL